MKQVIVDIVENKLIADNTYSITLLGDFDAVIIPGQFVNIMVPDKFLRRPISVCRRHGDVLTLVYKVVGDGTKTLSQMGARGSFDVLTGLGNGFDLSVPCQKPLLIGGGAGVAPLFWLTEELIKAGKQPQAVLGFNTSDEIFLAGELAELGVSVSVATLDGSSGVKGFVTDAMKNISDFDYIYTCGPEPMLRAVYSATETDGEFSFEERMACGFGACMGCSCRTKYGAKRICRDGPVLKRGEIIW